MHQYRVVIETERSGKKWYYVQKKGFLFWRYVREVYDVSMQTQRVGYSSMEEAEEAIKFEVDYDNIMYNKQIVKKEYLLK